MNENKKKWECISFHLHTLRIHMKRDLNWRFKERKRGVDTPMPFYFGLATCKTRDAEFPFIGSIHFSVRSWCSAHESRRFSSRRMNGFIEASNCHEKQNSRAVIIGMRCMWRYDAGQCTRCDCDQNMNGKMAHTEQNDYLHTENGKWSEMNGSASIESIGHRLTIAIAHATMKEKIFMIVIIIIFKATFGFRLFVRSFAVRRLHSCGAQEHVAAPIKCIITSVAVCRTDRIICAKSKWFEHGSDIWNWRKIAISFRCITEMRNSNEFKSKLNENGYNNFRPWRPTLMTVSLSSELST